MNKIGKWRLIGSAYLSYIKRKRKLGYTPIRLWIEPTNLCNLKCPICPQSYDNISERNFMDFKLFQELMDQINGAVYDVNLSHRGESLFHPDLIPMITEAHNAGLKTRLHTNGMLLNKTLSKELLFSPLDLLSFSVDGTTKEEYERIRVGGDFDTVISNIYNFLLLKKKYRKNKPYVIIQMIDLEGKRDLKKYERFRSRFDGLPLDKFYVKLPHNWAGNIKGEFNNQVVSLSPCTFPWYSMTIFWDGTVVPCPQDWYGDIKLGNIKEKELLDIWNDVQIQELRRNMSKLDIEKYKPCSNCDRIRRKTVLGVPIENFKAFVAETLLGYKLSQKLVKK